MTPRIEKLRKQSQDAIPTLSPERAELITEFYQKALPQRESVPVQRALAFKHLMENKAISIIPGELIVGERGPSPKATPTYPEICIHSQDDLSLLDSRDKVPYKVSKQTRKIYAEKITPYWTGKSNRERILAHLPPEWHQAYEAAVFTEFQEQRSPGHTAMGNKIYQKGFLDLKQEIKAALVRLDYYNDPQALDKQEQLKAMDICGDALITFARRHAETLDKLAAEEAQSSREAELREMARICRKVPAHKPETFWEALQMYWFVHVGVITELNPWDAFNPGRLDQHLFPFFQREIDDGTLTLESAKELLQAFWIKFNNHPAPPKVGVTAKESNTYVDFALINIGGVTRDNRNGVNELSYLLLETVEEMRLLQPSSMIQVSRKNPDRFVQQALKIIRTGFGQPSVFNTDAIVQELVRQGKTVEDAREGGASGCVEAGAFGREAYFLTGYFNLPKILEITLNNGVDPRTGRHIGLETGDVRDLTGFDQLYEAFDRQFKHFVDIKIKGNNIIERINAKYMPVPFLSLLIDDCIAAGKDYNAGGARYNTSYIQGVGLGTVTDALAAVRHHVFDFLNFSMADLLDALNNNFKNYEAMHNMLLHDTPKYGNDDDVADEIVVKVFESFYKAVDSRPNTRSGVHRINLLPTTCHVYFGSMIGALPDGRKAGMPLSEGISPVQGADRHGPTAVLKSAAKIDHIRTGGTLLNQRFLPQILAGQSGLNSLTHLIRGYFKMDGHHIQFNVVDSDTLRKAQDHPDDFRDLIVRVAGYSDYFVDLTLELQEEIICRTAHDDM